MLDINREYRRQEEYRQTPYEHVLPDGFVIPDLSPLKEGEGWDRTGTVKFPVVFGDETFEGRLMFARNKEEDCDSQRGRVELEVYRPNGTDYPERVMSFKAVLNKGQTHGDRYRGWSSDKERRQWHIHTRRVDDKGIRKKGMGTYGMQALEEAIRRVGEEYPGMRAGWIQLDTMLSSLSHMIIDPNWLKGKSGLGKKGMARAEKTERNLGYVPHPKDDRKALQLLEMDSVEADDIKSGDPDVRFVKPIDPSIKFEKGQDGRRW